MTTIDSFVMVKQQQPRNKEMLRRRVDRQVKQRKAVQQQAGGMRSRKIAIRQPQVFSERRDRTKERHKEQQRPSVLAGALLRGWR